MSLDDPETLVEKVKEFYDLAEEALNQQVARYEGDLATASRTEEKPVRSHSSSNGGSTKEPASNGKPSNSEWFCPNEPQR